MFKDTFDVLKDVNDKQLWVFFDKLFPSYKINILEDKFKIYKINDEYKITYDLKIYLLLK